MNLIKITKDKERVKQILEMVNLIEDRIKIQNKIKFASLILSDYYEIIKELITGLVLVEGYKILSHKELIDYLKLKPQIFEVKEIASIDKLRILRNRIMYEGKGIPLSYLISNEPYYVKIIKKLKSLIKERLK